MIKHGKPPYLECSSKGDKRFSAFYAQVGGQSIEQRYQAAKVFEDGSTGLSWREAKGRVAVNADEVRKLYDELWERYIYFHPELLDALIDASGLSDQFGQPGHACQATSLWAIRERALAGRVVSLIDYKIKRQDAVAHHARVQQRLKCQLDALQQSCPHNQREYHVSADRPGEGYHECLLCGYRL